MAAPVVELKPCENVFSLGIPGPAFGLAAEWAIKEWNGYIGCVGLTLGEGLPVGWGTRFSHVAYTEVWPAHPPWATFGVYVNPEIYDPGIHYLPCLFAHEFGHLLGLDDNQGPPIMDFSYWAGRVVSSCEVNH